MVCGGLCICLRVWKSEANLWDLLLSLHRVVSRDWGHIRQRPQAHLPSEEQRSLTSSLVLPLGIFQGIHCVLPERTKLRQDTEPYPKGLPSPLGDSREGMGDSCQERSAIQKGSSGMLGLCPLVPGGRKGGCEQPQ